MAATAILENGKIAIFTKFRTVTRIGTPYAGEYSKLQFKNSNMADSRHLEKSKIRNISATDWPILMKFSTVMQIWSLKRTSG